MAALALPPPESSSRELLRQARLIERLGVQRRAQLKRLAELDDNIRAARRMFKALTDLLLVPRPEDSRAPDPEPSEVP